LKLAKEDITILETTIKGSDWIEEYNRVKSKLRISKKDVTDKYGTEMDEVNGRL
jgi:hypothetical protein